MIKREFASWEDLPRSQTSGEPKLLESLDKNFPLFVQAQIEIFPHENPKKKVSQLLPLVDINCNSIALRFTPQDNHLHVQFIGEQNERHLDLDESDKIIDIKVTYENRIGLRATHLEKTLFIAKGTEAALCFHLGRVFPSDSRILPTIFL